MSTSTGIPAELTLHITQEIEIAAPLEVAFEAMLEQLGPHNEIPGGEPFPFVLEPWPGGRWFRDLGNDDGHLWGHVQVIKRPYLLEICGPLFMSYPAVSHIQYRLTEAGAGVKLTLTHGAIGTIDPEHRAGVGEGWGHWLDRIRERAQGAAG